MVCGGSPIIFLLPVSDFLSLRGMSLILVFTHLSRSTITKQRARFQALANIMFRFLQKACFGLDDLIAGTLEARMTAINGE